MVCINTKNVFPTINIPTIAKERPHQRVHRSLNLLQTGVFYPLSPLSQETAIRRRSDDLLQYFDMKYI